MKRRFLQSPIAATKIAPVSLLALTALACISGNVFAAEQGLCKERVTPIISEDTFSADGKTHLQSDNVELNEKDISRFNGNVVIQQKDKRIETEQAEYEKKTEQVEAIGNVRFTSSSIQIQSETAHFNLKSDQATLNKAEYQGVNSRMRGDASKIEVKDQDVTELSDATFTTCDKDDTDWLLSASKMTFDNKNRQGHASNVVVRFKGVPFFLLSLFTFSFG